MKELTYRPIGLIHSDIKSLDNAPIQAVYSSEHKGWIELYSEYQEGLMDIEGFSHIILIYHFHLCRGVALRHKPFLDNTPHGVFAIRSPLRPNPIGLSVVKLDGVMDGILHISGVDMLDGTPLLDIKPFIPQFDNRDGAKIGWFKDKV
jgi:tRNA (adenine37-N6)-methyltransferase